MTQTKNVLLEKIVGELSKQVAVVQKLEREGFMLLKVVESDNGLIDLSLSSIPHGTKEIKVVDGHRVYKEVLDPGTYLVYYR